MCLPEAEVEALRIVLLSAGDHGEVLAKLLDALRDQETEFELVEGVDLDSSRALDAMREHKSGALYVICLDEDLDEYSARHLQNTLRESKLVPTNRIIVLKLRAGRSILQAGALMKRAIRGARPRNSKAPKRGASGSMSGQRPGMSAAALAMQEMDSLQAEVSGAAPLPVEREASEPIVAQEPEAAPEPAPTARLGPSADAAAPAPSSDAEVDIEMDSRPADSPVPEVASAGEGEQLRLEESPPPVAAPAKGGGRFASMLGGMLLAAGGLAAFWYLAPSKFDGLSAQLRTQVGQEAPATAPAPAAQADAAPAPTPTPEPEPKAEPEPEPEAESTAVADTDGAPVEPEPEPEAQAEPEPEGPPPLDEAVVREALESGALRHTASFLVHPQRSARMTLDRAKNYCASMSYEGITGWRLPEIGELTTVLKRKLIGNNVYWTQTPGDSDGKLFLVYESFNYRVRNLEPNFKGAHGICVRDWRTLEKGEVKMPKVIVGPARGRGGAPVDAVDEPPPSAPDVSPVEPSKPDQPALMPKKKPALFPG